MTTNNRRILDELRSSVKERLYEILDVRFREFHGVTLSMFPDDEFDANEAIELASLCLLIATKGYREFETLVVSEKGQVLIDTAAGYGHFVGDEIGDSYLGVFIAAELNMAPLSMSTYESSLLQSTIFVDADLGTQELTVTLIRLARSLRDVNLDHEYRLVRCLNKVFFDPEEQNPDRRIW